MENQFKVMMTLSLFSPSNSWLKLCISGCSLTSKRWKKGSRASHINQFKQWDISFAPVCSDTLAFSHSAHPHPSLNHSEKSPSTHLAHFHLFCVGCSSGLKVKQVQVLGLLLTEQLKLVFSFGTTHPAYYSDLWDIFVFFMSSTVTTFSIWMCSRHFICTEWRSNYIMCLYCMKSFLSCVCLASGWLKDIDPRLMNYKTTKTAPAKTWIWISHSLSIRNR